MFDKWNKKQSIDIVDEDAKHLGFFYIFAKYIFPVLVALLLLGVIIGAGYWIIDNIYINGAKLI